MLSLLILGAGYAGTFSVSDASTVRGRLTYANVGQGTPATLTGALDLATAAVARLGLADRRWAFSLGYSPSYTAPDIQGGFDGQLFQSVDASVGWHDRRVSLFLSDSGSYGTYNSAYNFQPGAQLAGAMTAPGTTPGMPPSTSLRLSPQPATITSLANRSSAAVGYRPDGRTTLSLAGSFGLSRGIGPSAAATELPPERAIETDAGFSYAISPRSFSRTALSGLDTLVVGASCFTAAGTVIPMVTCRPDTQTLTLSESYSHSFDAATTFSIGGGPELTRTRTDQGVPYTTGVYPSGQASFGHKLAREGLASIAIGVQFAATPDYRTGVLQERAQGDVTLVDVLGPTVSLNLDAGAGQTLPFDSPLAATIVRATLEANFHVDRRDLLVLTTGVSTQWQTQNPFGYFFSSYGYFAVTAAAPALRF